MHGSWPPAVHLVRGPTSVPVCPSCTREHQASSFQDASQSQFLEEGPPLALAVSIGGDANCLLAGDVASSSALAGSEPFPCPVEDAHLSGSSGHDTQSSRWQSPRAQGSPTDWAP